MKLIARDAVSPCSRESQIVDGFTACKCELHLIEGCHVCGLEGLQECCAVGCTGLPVDLHPA